MAYRSSLWLKLLKKSMTANAHSHRSLPTVAGAPSTALGSGSSIPCFPAPQLSRLFG